MTKRTEIEIVEAPELTERQAGVLDMHSVLNIVNVLTGEIEILGILLTGQPEALRDSLEICRHFVKTLHVPELALHNAGGLSSYAERIENEITALLNRSQNAKHPEVQNGCQSIFSALNVFSVRATELIARAADAGTWCHLSSTTLEENFLQVLTAIQAHAKGRFGFAFSREDRRDNDYFIELTFDPGNERFFAMPTILIDMMRDLIANARQYTPPGGDLIAQLRQTREELQFQVEDTGRGIPEHELQHVVEFGYRATNVRDTRTRGGGFGLTKAVHTVKRLGGRIWIASEVGCGTRVRFTVPRRFAQIGVGQSTQRASDWVNPVAGNHSVLHSGVNTF